MDEDDRPEGEMYDKLGRRKRSGMFYKPYLLPGSDAKVPRTTARTVDQSSSRATKNLEVNMSHPAPPAGNSDVLTAETPGDTQLECDRIETHDDTVDQGLSSGMLSSEQNEGMQSTSNWAVSGSGSTGTSSLPVPIDVSCECEDQSSVNTELGLGLCEDRGEDLRTSTCQGAGNTSECCEESASGSSPDIDQLSSNVIFASDKSDSNSDSESNDSSDGNPSPGSPGGGDPGAGSPDPGSSGPSDQGSSSDSSGSSDSSSHSENRRPPAETRSRSQFLLEKYSLNDQAIDGNGKIRTKIECLLMVQCLALRHNLNDVAIQDLLKSYNCLIGTDSLPCSSYLFNEIFSYDSGVEYHFFCSKCDCYLGSKSDLDQKADANSIYKCPVKECEFACDLSTMNDENFFIVLPLKNQLRCFLETQSNINEMLASRFNRENSNDTVRDVYDGLLYKELSKPGGILSEKSNLSITLNTDGARVFRSGNSSMWPVMCRLNELPPEVRFNVENIFITGLWFGKHPNMKCYLSQFALEARTLYSEGFEWKNCNDEMVCSKVVTLNACFDSVALCQVQCTSQFNAYFGCSYCYHPGYLVNLTDDVLVSGNEQPLMQNVRENVDFSGSETEDVDVDDPNVVESEAATVEQTLAANQAKKKVKQVRYSYLHGVHPDRTHEEIRADMVESETAGKAVRGVRGISPLIVLFGFNLVSGFVIDYMHAVLLGVTKQMLNLWLNPKFSKQNFSVRNRINEIDQRLLQFKPPLKLFKRFESVKNYSSYKANMLEPWLLFYGIPCLIDILPDVHLRHFALLVTSTHNLLLDCISQAQLVNCHDLLLKFVEEFETLYGPSQMTYNVHLVTHLVTCVRNWGPLWCYSAFGFESGNGMLLKLVSGTRGVMTQIARKYISIRYLPKILQAFDLSDDIVEFCDEILIVSKKCKVAAKFVGVTLLGDSTVVPLTNEECVLLQEANVDLSNTCYQRMISNGVKYHSKMYVRQGKKTFDGGVFLIDKTFGVIQRIFLWENRVYVIIRSIEIESNMPIVTHSSSALASHIRVCKLYPYGDLRLIRASDVCAKCIILKTELGTYVTLSPNNYQKD